MILICDTQHLMWRGRGTSLLYACHSKRTPNNWYGGGGRNRSLFLTNGGGGCEVSSRFFIFHSICSYILDIPCMRLYNNKVNDSILLGVCRNASFGLLHDVCYSICHGLIWFVLELPFTLPFQLQQKSIRIDKKAESVIK